MNFNADRLPSSTREIEWYWRQHIQESFNLSHININGSAVNFNLPSDYFEISDTAATRFHSLEDDMISFHSLYI